jgi:uncharacterized repeat protein (TIGR03803 family)
MNYARQQGKSFHIIAAFVAAIVALTFILAATPARAQTQPHSPVFKVIYDVPGGTGEISNPAAYATAQGRDGNIYTTSEYGGTQSYGTLFKVTPSGTATIVNSIGYFVVSGATLGTDGNFYGANLDGGPGGDCGFAGCGQVYKVTPSGVLTLLYNFTGYADGADPYSAPIEGTDGKFYGTTFYSNGTTNSTVYSVTSSGTFKTLHTFTAAEGQSVTAGLVQGTDGNFYGVASSGGANDWGTIFKMTPAGDLTVLYSFCSVSNCADGATPYDALIQASDGNFYGTTSKGGTAGVAFKITPGGTYSVLHNFVPQNGDGAYPSSSLVQATDGKLYGVTPSGGSGSYGTIYSITTSGTFTTLHTFANTDGDNPQSPLKQNSNGLLYGTTYSGGSSTNCDGGGCGVVYSLNIGAKPFVSLVSTSGKEGTNIGILGQGFNTSSVAEFGGVQATVIKIKPHFIEATVPAGALTGSVTVTTGSTELTSNRTFRVTPTLLSFSPTSGPVGTPVTITGTGLTQTTEVTFGGVAQKTFTVNSDTQVTADVPAGAVSGKIVIKTKGGSAASKTDFTVTQ